MRHLKSVQENERHKILWDLKIQTDPGKKTRPSDNYQKKKKENTCCLVNFAVSVDHKVKIKENKNRHKYLDLARELKSYGTWKRQWYQLWLVHLERFPETWPAGRKGWEIEGRTYTIQTTDWLRLVRILRRVLETWGGLLSLRLQWKNISWRLCKKLVRNNNTKGNERKI